MPRLILALIVVLSAGSGLVAQSTVPAARDLAAKIQAHYDTVRDFTADFTQVLTSPMRPRPKHEAGHVWMKKPLEMRWQYTTSDKSEFVSDGMMFYSKFPEDRSVDISPLPEEEGTSTWLLFLAGRGDLTRDYRLSVPDDQPAGEWQLTLRPLEGREADFETLTIVVDRDTYELVGLIAHDLEGGTSEFRFTSLRENRGLKDSAFAFAIPDGYESNLRR